MVDFHFSGKQIVKVKINCYFLDQVREGSGGGVERRGCLEVICVSPSDPPDASC